MSLIRKRLGSGVIEFFVRLPYLFCLLSRGAEALKMFQGMFDMFPDAVFPAVATGIFVLAVFVILHQLDGKKTLSAWSAIVEIGSTLASLLEAWRYAHLVAIHFVPTASGRFVILAILFGALQVGIHFLTKRAPTIMRNIRNAFSRRPVQRKRRLRIGKAKPRLAANT